MNVLKKINFSLVLILLVFGACETEPKPKPPPAPPVITLPLAYLSGTWEVSDAERNGKNTTALEGIYFTFTEDKKLITNFNLSIEEKTLSYQMRGDTLYALSVPPQPYIIESLEEKAMVLRTKMQGYPFKLTLKNQESSPTEEGI